ncbi:unnamed protein product [Rotaria sp. Silwood2]|nr:unnamed protein product [Rotaria sp. Silwood2]
MSANTTPYDPSIDPLNPFGYLPNLDLTIVSTAVYGLITILLTIFSIYYRTWYFLVMTISGIAEVVGYAYRWSLAKDPDQRTPYQIFYFDIDKYKGDANSSTTSYGTWNDNDEFNELSQEANEAMRENRRIEREKKLREHQQRKLEKEASRTLTHKRDSLS